MAGSFPSLVMYALLAWPQNCLLETAVRSVHDAMDAMQIPVVAKQEWDHQDRSNDVRLVSLMLATLCIL